MMQAQLGMVPSWQYSADPGVNIKLNDHVSFPPGWTQGTIQPVGAYYTTARIAQPQLNGIGSRVKRFFGLGCGSCGPTSLAGLGESWAYENRKALLISGVGLMTAALLGFTALKAK